MRGCRRSAVSAAVVGGLDDGDECGCECECRAQTAQRLD